MGKTINFDSKVTINDKEDVRIKAREKIKNWIRTRHIICQGNFFIFESLEYPTIERFEKYLSSLGGTLIVVNAVKKVWIGNHRKVILYQAKGTLYSELEEFKQYWFKYGGINSRFESFHFKK